MADEELKVKGVCACGNDLWRWEIEGYELTLTCSGYGKQVHFGVLYPTLSIVSDALPKKG